MCHHRSPSESEALITSLPVCRPSSSACSRLALGHCPPTVARGSTGSCTPRQATAHCIQHCQSAWKSYLAVTAHCFITQQHAASSKHPVVRSLLVRLALQVAGETEVKAQIKLRFSTATGQPVVIVRSFQVVPHCSRRLCSPLQLAAGAEATLRLALPASKPCVTRPNQEHQSACPPICATCKFGCRTAGPCAWHTEAGLHRR